uniref:Hepcidin n=1 Tax=Cyclopterus lumpus TaxID=8103 RepID=A0A8C2ZMY8_CYCLU
MKTFPVAVAVAVVLTFICVQQSSAVPVREPGEPMSVDNPAADHEETDDAGEMPYNNREKRGVRCKFCCNCCTRGVCGLCCRF